MRKILLVAAGALLMPWSVVIATRSMGIDPCLAVDLGDVVVCSNRVAGVEPDAFGGSVIEVVVRGRRTYYATELPPAMVFDALEEVRS